MDKYVYGWIFKFTLRVKINIYNYINTFSNLSINLTWQDLEKRLGFKVNKNVEVKFRKTGENIKIKNSNKSLKDFMRENKIPPWERERILLIYIDKELKAIWDWISKLFVRINFQGQI